MTTADPAAWYDNHVHDVVPFFESYTFTDIHAWLEPLLPAPDGALVLDVGAGSGRDAAWLAEQGYEVVAVEPSARLREEARRRHPHPRIRYLDDRLPALQRASRLGTDFDVILLCAVWMHVPPPDRARAFRKLVNLLKPGGLMAFVLRHGPAEPERGMHPVSVEEIERLAREHGAFVRSGRARRDQLDADRRAAARRRHGRPAAAASHHPQRREELHVQARAAAHALSHRRRRVGHEPRRGRKPRERAARASGPHLGTALSLRPSNLDIDHCFPWAAWPCNDLWNLLPVRREVNRQKGSRLPDAVTLQRAAERIVGWWEEGYRRALNPLVPERFVQEAAASLPTLPREAAPELEDIYEAVNLRRIRLKHDQRVAEWVAG